MSLNNVIILLELFQHSSGLKINIEPLGIVFTHNEEDNYLLNYKQKILNLQTTLNIWKQRCLSIKGKITIINTLTLSPLIYVSSVISTPIIVYREVDNIIQNFIWNGGSSKISKISLSQNMEKGGLKL